MKNLLLAFSLIFTFVAQSQTWSHKIENAQFQVRVNGHTPSSCIVRKMPQSLYTKDEFKSISDRCLQKEGVFNLELSEDKSTITIYVFEWIDQWTIDWLFSEALPEFSHSFRISQKTPFSF